MNNYFGHERRHWNDTDFTLQNAFVIIYSYDQHCDMFTLDMLIILLYMLQVHSSFRLHANAC